jgi:hypothetical protein
MEVNVKLHSPAALLSGKKPSVLTVYEAGWALRTGLEAVKKRRMCYPSEESNRNLSPRSLSP